MRHIVCENSHAPESDTQSEQEENLTASPAHAAGSSRPPRMCELGADAMADL